MVLEFDEVVAGGNARLAPDSTSRRQHNDQRQQEARAAAEENGDVGAGLRLRYPMPIKHQQINVFMCVLLHVFCMTLAASPCLANKLTSLFCPAKPTWGRGGHCVESS